MALLKEMPPYQTGGDMIDSVTFEKTTFGPPPRRFEAGTPAIAEVIGLGAAIDYVEQLGMANIEAHEAALLAYATEQLQQINGLTIIGQAQHKASLISFTLDGVHPHDIGTLLDEKGIAVRAGHHCAQPLMKRYGVSATTRVSFGIYNTMDDVDKLVEGLKFVQNIFGA
jgi:cysteine desulfurase/selenocysteine lyase